MRCYSSLLAVVLSALVPVVGFTQPPYNPYAPIGGPYSRPNLSPYLNLLRGGLPAANYYMGVLPEIERRDLQARLPALLQEPPRPVEPLQPDALEPPVARQLPPTGHPTGFLIYDSYFNMPNMRRLGQPTPSPGQPRLR